MTILRQLALIVTTVLAGAGCGAEAAEEESESSVDALHASRNAGEDGAEARTAALSKTAACFDKRWDTVAFSTETGGADKYNGDEPFTRLVIGSLGVVRAFPSPYYTIAGGMVIKALEGKMRETIDEQKLADYQVVLLASCVSSRLITYTHPSPTKFGSVRRIALEQKGECTEFAAFAEMLLKDFRVPARDLGSLDERHAYNEVTLTVDGRAQKFYFEPQRSGERSEGFFLNAH